MGNLGEQSYASFLEFCSQEKIELNGAELVDVNDFYDNNLPPNPPDFVLGLGDCVIVKWSPILGPRIKLL